MPFLCAFQPKANRGSAGILTSPGPLDPMSLDPTASGPERSAGAAVPPKRLIYSLHPNGLSLLWADGQLCRLCFCPLPLPQPSIDRSHCLSPHLCLDLTTPNCRKDRRLDMLVRAVENRSRSSSMSSGAPLQPNPPKAARMNATEGLVTGEGLVCCSHAADRVRVSFLS